MHMGMPEEVFFPVPLTLNFVSKEAGAQFNTVISATNLAPPL